MNPLLPECARRQMDGMKFYLGFKTPEERITYLPFFVVEQCAIPLVLPITFSRIYCLHADTVLGKEFSLLPTLFLVMCELWFCF